MSRRPVSLALTVFVVSIATLLTATVVVTLGGSAESGTAVWRRAPLLLAMVAAVFALLGAVRLIRELARRQGVEDELRASRATFEGILAIAVDAIITVDAERRILHFNRGAELLFGWAEAEVVGASLNVLIPERFHAAHDRHIAAFGEGRDVARRMGERRAIFGQRRDGSEFPAEASISRLDLPGRRLFTVVLRDITHRLRVEEGERFLARASAVLATSLDYDSTLRSVVHLAIPHLADCCILDVTESPTSMRRVVSVHEDPAATRWLRRFEQRRLEAGNWPFPSATVLSSGRPVLRQGLAPGWEHEGGGAGDPRAADLGALGVHALLSLPLVARDRAIGVLTLLATDPARQWGERDLTLASALTERAAFAIDNAGLYQLSQQSARARDELLGVVSHDLRNPLSAISMCARVLLENPPDATAERQDLLAAIVESTRLMQRLIQDLLDVSTIESGHLRIHPRTESFAPIVDRVLQMVKQPAADRGVALVCTLPEELPEVEVDAMRVEQVLANLVGNGIKFTESGGRVTIVAELAGDLVRVRVSDTGVGIPADQLPRIFDRYWHARRQSRTLGTGLGLAIARGLVEAHGGTLTVESTPGVGTTFAFSLPVATRTVHATVAPPPRAPHAALAPENRPM